MNIRTAVSSLVFVAMCAVSASAGVLDFENQPDLLAGYAGLSWSGAFHVLDPVQSLSPYVPAAVSGTGVGYWQPADGSGILSAQDGSAFDFISGYFASPWNSGEQITINGLFQACSGSSVTFQLRSGSGPAITFIKYMS